MTELTICMSSFVGTAFAFLVIQGIIYLMQG
jgi:hypothetical protein